MANWSFAKTAESARRCATEPRAFSPRPVVGRGLSLSGEDRGALFGIFPARLFFYLAWPIPVSVAMSQTSDKQTFCPSEIVLSQFDLPPSYPMGIAIHSPRQASPDFPIGCALSQNGQRANQPGPLHSFQRHLAPRQWLLGRLRVINHLPSPHCSARRLRRRRPLRGHTKSTRRLGHACWWPPRHSSPAPPARARMAAAILSAC
jgi:hypothetical protein